MIEKILERLEELYDRNDRQKKTAYEEQDWEKFDLFMHRNEGVYSALAIVQEVAKEYGNGWIPCDERLPEDFRAVLITAISLNGMSYTEIGKWNGEQWFHGASNTRIDIAEVVAWMELPAPYKKKGE